MMNQVILVGRLVNDINAENKNEVNITLACPRQYKNTEGIYETDFIPCKLWTNIAQNSAEYLTKGDLVGVKGRIQSKDDNIMIVAEKLTFLSSKKQEV